MEKAETMKSLDTMSEVASTGDLRRIVSTALLALARKQISATDGETMAKMLDSVSNSLSVEIKMARLNEDIRKAGGQVVKVAETGRLSIT